MCKCFSLFLDDVRRIVGLVYGPLTGNFMQYKKDLIDKLEAQKEIKKKSYEKEE